jgi:hypothetical protein
MKQSKPKTKNKNKKQKQNTNTKANQTQRNAIHTAICELLGVDEGVVRKPSPRVQRHGRVVRQAASTVRRRDAINPNPFQHKTAMRRS